MPRYEFAGELALGGALRPIRGALPMALSARRDGRAFVLPAESAAEAALVRGARSYPASSLLAVCAHLTGRESLAALAPQRCAPSTARRDPDLADVRGQEHAKRALTIAAAGAHSLLMIGPPGTGKSMLAQRLPGILPPLSEDEALAAAAIASLAGRFSAAAWGVAALSRAAPHGERRRAGRRRQRPSARRNLARAPRRAVPRRVAGVGPPRARGAARAARVGRDPHLARRAAEHLSRRVPVHRRDESLPLRLAWPRERALPLHARSASRATAAASPVRCIDRIDLGIEVPALAAEALAVGAERTRNVRRTVRPARACARRSRPRAPGRWRGRESPMRASSPREIEAHCQPDAAGAALLAQAMARLSLSARAYHRILKVARTIADLAEVRPSRRRTLPKPSPTDVSIACEKCERLLRSSRAVLSVSSLPEESPLSSTK